MAERASEHRFRGLRRSCWLPAATVVAIELYVRGFEGWGAWAAAPLLLIPAIISLPIVIFGLTECAAAARARAPLRVPLLLTLVAATPLIWLGVRRFLV